MCPQHQGNSTSYSGIYQSSDSKRSTQEHEKLTTYAGMQAETVRCSQYLLLFFPYIFENANHGVCMTLCKQAVSHSPTWLLGAAGWLCPHEGLVRYLHCMRMHVCGCRQGPIYVTYHHQLQSPNIFSKVPNVPENSVTASDSRVVNLHPCLVGRRAARQADGLPLNLHAFLVLGCCDIAALEGCRYYTV
jgi:hypothetical protein